MVNDGLGKKYENNKNRASHAKAAKNTPRCITGHYHPIRRRGNEKLLNTALEFVAEERAHHVGKRVVEARHHHQTRHDEGHVTDALVVADLGADELPED